MAIIRQGIEKPWKLAFDCLRLDRPDADFRRNYNYYDESVERSLVRWPMQRSTNDHTGNVDETCRGFLSIQAIGFALLAGKMGRRYQQSTIEPARRRRSWVRKCLLHLLQDVADMSFIRLMNKRNAQDLFEESSDASNVKLFKLFIYVKAHAEAWYLLAKLDLPCIL